MITIRDARRHLVRCLLAACGPALLGGCAPMAAVGAAASMASSAMQIAGLKDPDDAPHKVPLTLEAGSNLNLSDGMPMSVVARVYQLRDTSRFRQAPMTVLMDPAQESGLLGPDIIAAHEVMLTPGQRYVHTEEMPPDGKALGVVVFFHAPARGGWKQAFDVADDGGEGVAIRLDADAMRLLRGRALWARHEFK